MFYTNVAVRGNNILFRGVKNGRRISKKIKYSPSLFLPSNVETSYKNLNGEYLTEKIFNDIKDAKDFIKQYTDVENFNIYGNTRYQNSFIQKYFSNEIEYNYDQIKIGIVDIETNSSNGFESPETAREPITAITITYTNGDVIIFGYADYRPKKNEKYYKYSNEIDMMKNFITFWETDYLDIVSGWNIQGYDIPYIYNRLINLFGESISNKLSPWGVVYKRSKFINDKEHFFYDIVGIGVLDYLDLYKYYSPKGKSQESYKLNDIAFSELGEEKVDYSEYGTLHELYEKNPQLFFEYNVHDTSLILRLDEKLKLFDLALSIAYDNKVNYNDIFSQTRMWDSLIYSYLMNKNVIVPINKFDDVDVEYVGGYVKEPKAGMYDWVMSFDFASLYPHEIMANNISPETIVDPRDYTKDIIEIIGNGISVDNILQEKIDLSKIGNYCVTPNGQFWSRDKQGFLPEILEKLYLERKKYKSLMLEKKKEYELCKDEIIRKQLNKEISNYNNIQTSKKLSLNSVYGAFGNKYFRFYDIRVASAVTTSGQLSIKWIEKKLNTYLNKVLGKDNEDYCIYMDTDSLFLNFADVVKKFVKSDVILNDKIKVIDFMHDAAINKMQPIIKKSCSELAIYTNKYKEVMDMKLEKICDRSIFLRKKRYVLNVYENEGVRYNEPELLITGLEIVRSSTPRIVRGRMMELVRLILNETELSVQQFISKFRKEFEKLNLEDISFPRGLNGMDKYYDEISLYKKGTPLQVRGALVYNEHLNKLKLLSKYPLAQNGDKIKYIYLKKPNPIKSDVISYNNNFPHDFGLSLYIDYEKQFYVAFLKPIIGILEVIGWKHEKTNTLDMFL